MYWLPMSVFKWISSFTLPIYLHMHVNKRKFGRNNSLEYYHMTWNRYTKKYQLKKKYQRGYWSKNRLLLFHMNNFLEYWNTKTFWSEISSWNVFYQRYFLENNFERCVSFSYYENVSQGIRFYCYTKLFTIFTFPWLYSFITRRWLLDCSNFFSSEQNQGHLGLWLDSDT